MAKTLHWVYHNQWLCVAILILVNIKVLIIATLKMNGKKSIEVKGKKSQVCA